MNIYPNLLFLTGQIESVPDGDTIYKIHKNWWNDFNKLERHHGYIQWLFPLLEPGVNELAEPLSNDELRVKVIGFIKTY